MCFVSNCSISSVDYASGVWISSGGLAQGPLNMLSGVSTVFFHQNIFCPAMAAFGFPGLVSLECGSVSKSLESHQSESLDPLDSSLHVCIKDVTRVFGIFFWATFTYVISSDELQRFLNLSCLFLFI